ncbi:SycD/LcrH family type III secretion system chaperone [Endozoicomonas sp. SCSIO W0465]|uniref:SycD/LcrH family type III secretion system chaperone n=1 Tax=Endozoicomonas sp. SCSIO W0465 TaxID=2918516 RepID=UPI0020764F18|nr:SycD/LcrH family type III secretion system chaperone [Endozoicomonas sp. SCSIO W0465]USE35287.1 SycD/LcrH family type III secretion system chaperone [Endozoicomonas sp. SCSIO W0465]
MNNEDLNDYEGSELEDKLLNFFGEGGTFKDLKNMSDDAMEAIYSVAYNLYQGGKYEEAKKVFQFLCFYDHFNRKYFLGLGACQQMQKQYDSAIEIFSFATLLDSDDPRPMMYIGDCHLAKGDRENARISYETSIDWAGDSPKYAGDLDRAKNMLENLK